MNVSFHANLMQQPQQEPLLLKIPFGNTADHFFKDLHEKTLTAGTPFEFDGGFSSMIYGGIVYNSENLNVAANNQKYKENMYNTIYLSGLYRDILSQIRQYFPVHYLLMFRSAACIAYLETNKQYPSRIVPVNSWHTDCTEKIEQTDVPLRVTLCTYNNMEGRIITNYNHHGKIHTFNLQPEQAVLFDRRTPHKITYIPPLERTLPNTKRIVLILDFLRRCSFL